MIKPQGVWLRPTELGEVAVATVKERGVSSKDPAPSGKQPAPTSASTKRRAIHPLLTVALGACCCLLIGLVSLHIYAGALPPPAAAAGEAGEAALPQPVQATALVPLPGLTAYAFGGAPDFPAQSPGSITPATLPEPVKEEPGQEEGPLLPPAEEAASQPADKPAPPAAPSRAIEKQPVLASRSGDSADAGEIAVGEEVFRYTRRLSMECTAYTWTGDKTATGTWPAVGTIAVDPRIIALGTKVYVEGYGFAIAEDTGRLIKGNIIDVYLDTEDQCVIWGRKRGVTVYILE